MMFYKTVLAFALVAAASAQTSTNTATVSASAGAATANTATASGSTTTATTTRRPFLFGFQNALNSLGNSGRAMIGLFNSTAHTGTKMFSDGVQGFTGAGQQMISTTSSLGSSALKGGVDAAKQAVTIGTNMAGIVPGLSGIASMGGGMANAALDVGNMMGQTGIGLGSGIANGKLQLVSGLSGAGAGLATSGINMASNMATTGLETGLSAANGMVGTIGGVMDTAADYVNQGSAKLSTLASTTADRMSASTAALPSSLNLQVGASTSG